MTPLPRWDTKNLKNHTAARRLKDPGCFEGLLNLKSLKPDDLRAKSESVVTSPCLVYEAKEIQKGKLRVYFVDAHMVLAATNRAKNKFITCYHVHPGPGKCPGKPAHYEQLRQLLIEYRDKLRRDHRREVAFQLFRV